MNDALVLFPHQLFESNASLAAGARVFLVEDPLYFRQFPFHKQKLVLHRATMRMHADHLRKAGAAVEYLDTHAATDMPTVIEAVTSRGVGALRYIDPVDDWLENRLRDAAAKSSCALRRLDTPMFLSTEGFIREHFGDKKRVLMADFYVAQRKALGLLVQNGKPVGGRWSLDTENRKPLPRGHVAPEITAPRDNAYVREARAYVDRWFPDNPGASSDFAYPVTYADARAWLTEFLERRLVLFGDYEDAISSRQPTLYHSVLTPMLNCGLLTPDEVVATLMRHAATHAVPLNALEGFLRQVIGWREYMRAAYVFRGRAQRTRNFWRHHRALPAAFWRGDTGIDPIDVVVRSVLRRAYAHHIERLMVLGNFMLLCEISPDDVYRWFMQLFIDAYDWVMVPNVYGMSLYAGGPGFVTKPYISGSNYIRKMSDFGKAPWCEIWDALFWRFVAEHREFFSGNPRLMFLVRQVERKDSDALARQREIANGFLDGLR